VLRLPPWWRGSDGNLEFPVPTATIAFAVIVVVIVVTVVGSRSPAMITTTTTPVDSREHDLNCPLLSLSDFSPTLLASFAASFVSFPHHTLFLVSPHHSVMIHSYPVKAFGWCIEFYW